MSEKNVSNKKTLIRNSGYSVGTTDNSNIAHMRPSSKSNDKSKK